MATRTKTFEYTVALRREQGRVAVLESGDRPAVVTAPPGDFQEGDDARWSPEHLFLASLESCTMLSYLSHAEHNGVEVRDYTAEIEGTVMRRVEDGRYAFVFVRHRPRVVVAAGQREAARALVGKAERDCFISASTTAELQVDWDVVEE